MPEPRDSRLWVTHQGRNCAFFRLSKPYSSHLLLHDPFCKKQNDHAALAAILLLGKSLRLGCTAPQYTGQSAGLPATGSADALLRGP